MSIQFDKNLTIVDYKREALDTATVFSEISNVLNDLHTKSYLTASLDSLVWRDSLTVAYINIGEQWQWVSLRAGNVAPALFAQIGFRERFYDHKDFNYHEIPIIADKLLTFLENNGYPFASVYLDSISIDDNKISAAWHLNRNRLITYDGIRVEGGMKIRNEFLENYLNLTKGDIYNKSQLLKIANRIKELNFVKEKKPLTVTFAGDKAIINLSLEKKKASRFDLLLGVLPNIDLLAPRRLYLSFSGVADMENQLGLGEKFYASFEQLKPQTQRLELRFAYPYILSLPFGVDTRFNLYKRDSTYLDNLFDLGVQYFFESNDYIKIFWNNSSTSLLSINEAQLMQTRRLPSTLDVRFSLFGIEYQKQHLDYRFNPRRGWSVWARGGAGVKKIIKNLKITTLVDVNDGFRYESLYDSLLLSSFQYKTELKLETFIPIFKRFTLRTALNGAAIISPKQAIFQNEQYRLGGNRNLRGFDEEQLFATRFLIATLEYRLLLGQNSYLSVFGDYAYLEDFTKNLKNINRPLGIGAGITFDTKVGVFGISLALGNINSSGFDYRTIKTHLGYVSRF